MSIIKPTKEEEHVEQLLKRIRVAKELGQGKKLKHWVRVYLNSYDANYLAVRRANGQLKLDRRFDKAELRAIAGRLDAWKGTKEEVLVHLKRKPSNPNYFRIYMAFGIENRALQYLVLRLLEILADLVPYQYTIRGGVPAAIKHVANAMSTGPMWAVELDVNDCYQSFDGNKLPSLLSLPKEVSECVLISKYLHRVPGNIAYHFGSTGDDPGDPVSLEETLVAARQGIPQGSAASPLIAETMLAMALREVPDLGVKVAYGDNSLLMANEESDMVTMMEALRSALKAHPVGLLWPKCKMFKPGEPVEFLGHCLTPKAGGKVRIDPSPKNAEKFEAMMVAKLNHLRFAKLAPKVRAREYRELQHYVRSWTAAFGLCEGISDFRAYWLKKIAKVSPLAA
jgi:Reverse transcriptase (RNA-dependent DNA polymerase)